MCGHGKKKNAKKRERSASIKRGVQTDLSQDVRRQENPARLQVICPSQPMRQQEETASQPRQCPARCLCTPQIWEGGREDTRPPCSGTGPLPTGGVSLEVSQDGCPARLPQGHQPACPAARAEERRGGAGIWWGQERKSVKPRLPGTARLIPRSQPHTPSTLILDCSDGCLGEGQAL